MDEKGKVKYISSRQEGKELVKKHPKYVLLGPKESLHALAATDCDVTVLDGTMIPVWFSICLQKQSKYSHIISTEIRQLVEKGFIIKWMNDYTFYLAKKQGNNTCIYQEGFSTKGTPINLDRAQGAFLILAVGVAMAIFSIFYEHIQIFLGYIFHLYISPKVGQADVPNEPVGRLATQSSDVPPAIVEPTGEIDMEGFNQIQVNLKEYESRKLDNNGKFLKDHTNGFTNGYNLKHRKVNNMGEDSKIEQELE